MKKKGKKRRKSEMRNQAELNRAMKRVEPVVVPLCELFATVDDVFTEEGAFTDEHIKKSLGRIYREWKMTRSALDPDFDPSDYERRPRKVGENPRSPLAMASQNSSTARKSTSAQRESRKGGKGKTAAKRSAGRARSGGRASNGR